MALACPELLPGARPHQVLQAILQVPSPSLVVLGLILREEERRGCWGRLVWVQRWELAVLLLVWLRVLLGAAHILVGLGRALGWVCCRLWVRGR